MSHNTCTSCGQITYSSRGEKGDTGATGATGATGTAGATGGTTQATIVANTGTVALLEAQTGSKVVLDRLSGSVITLPDTPADGTNYEFITKTDLTSNNYIINAGIGGFDVFNGAISVSVAGAAGVLYSTAVATIITLDGTATGGDIGTAIKVSYSETENIWYVSGTSRGSGATSTPFS